MHVFCVFIDVFCFKLAKAQKFFHFFPLILLTLFIYLFACFRTLFQYLLLVLFFIFKSHTFMQLIRKKATIKPSNQQQQQQQQRYN